MIIMDSRLDDLHGGKLPKAGHLLKIAGGEGNKNPETLIAIWKAMASAGLRRDSTVMVMGGGTVCDTGAFAVSTWKRGMRLVLVPTTLLCMVDASLGGKTAVNIGEEKNQAGTFFPASEVMVCEEFLSTLPEREMKSGIAEALKTAVVGDRTIADRLIERNYVGAVEACIRVKGEIVSRDLEETGLRRLLNLGHTLGHSIEAVTRFEIPHGIAVAMGIPVAARMGGFNDFAGEFTSLAGSLGIDTAIPEEIFPDKVLKFLDSDKKSSADGRAWIIPRGWEDCVQVILKPKEEALLLKRSWQ